MFQYSLCHGMDIGTCDFVHWSVAPQLDWFLGVRCSYVECHQVRYSCHHFLDRILFHHDFHHDSCDYHWDFYVH